MKYDDAFEIDPQYVLSAAEIREVPSCAVPNCSCPDEILIFGEVGDEYQRMMCGTCYKRGNLPILQPISMTIEVW